ncbi:MAG: hypothetical protein ACF8NJ_02010, partial [Phycisphaerales bacterium JB038]
RRLPGAYGRTQGRARDLVGRLPARQGVVADPLAHGDESTIAVAVSAFPLVPVRSAWLTPAADVEGTTLRKHGGKRWTCV